MLIEQTLKKDGVLDCFKMPIISVIVTAHDRREFLMDAITSLVNQTLDKSLFEVILVKNFEENEIDKMTDKIQLNIIKSSNNSLVGDDLECGIKAAKGEIISFLDDDDIFLPEKLETVMKVFNNDPSLIYYHNSQILKGASEKVFENRIKYKETLSSNEVIKRLPRLIKKFGTSVFYFNLSSISIRKCVYSEYLGYLHNLPDHQDDFFFFIGLQMGGKFFFDNLKLTIYRVHFANTSVISKKVYKDRKSYFYKKSALYEKQSKATNQILTVVSNMTLREYLKCKESHEKALMNFYRNEFCTRDMVMLLIGVYCNGFRYTSWRLITLLKEKYYSR